MPAKKYFTEEARLEAIRISAKKTVLKNRERIRARNREYRKSNPDKSRASSLAWYYKNREAVNAKRREFRKAHPEITKAENDKYRLSNPDKYRAMQMEWYYKNPEKVQRIRSKTRAKNRDKILAYSKEYARRFPEKGIQRQARRRVKFKVHPSASPEAMLAIYKAAREQTVKTGIKHCVDHIIPVKHHGWHHEDNLQVMTKKLNSSKYDKPFWLAPHAGLKDWRDVPRELWPLDLIPQYLALLEKHKGETIRWDVAA